MPVTNIRRFPFIFAVLVKLSTWSAVPLGQEVDSEDLCLTFSHLKMS
jgi:hypothetical protein